MTAKQVKREDRLCPEISSKIAAVEVKILNATSFDEREKFVRERSILQSKRIAKADRESPYKPSVNMPTC